MSDITLKVKVKNADGEWVASTPVYDIGNWRYSGNSTWKLHFST